MLKFFCDLISAPDISPNFTVDEENPFFCHHCNDYGFLVAREQDIMAVCEQHYSQRTDARVAVVFQKLTGFYFASSDVQNPQLVTQMQKV